jgi:hypothetical protein
VKKSAKHFQPEQFLETRQDSRSLHKYFCDHKKGFLHFKPLAFEHEVLKMAQSKGLIASFGKLGVSDM